MAQALWMVAVVVLGCLLPSVARARSPSSAASVVLVHGIYDTGTIFRPMVRELERQGYRCLAPALTPNDCSSGVRVLSLQLARAIDARFGKGAPVVIVGFSMGGLITRDYVQNLAAPGRVKAVFLISPPNHGTLWALFARAGTKQLGTNSRFLRSLNQQSTQMWQQISVRTYWTPLDLMIFPSTSSCWPVGDMKAVLCLMHPWMVRNPRLTEDLTKQLATITHEHRQAS